MIKMVYYTILFSIIFFCDSTNLRKNSRGHYHATEFSYLYLINCVL